MRDLRDRSRGAVAGAIADAESEERKAMPDATRLRLKDLDVDACESAIEFVAVATGGQAPGRANAVLHGMLGRYLRP